MRGVEFGLPVELHGWQCARATYIVARLYEKLFSITPNRGKAIEYVEKFDYNALTEKLKKFLGKGAQTMIELEKKEGKYDKDKHKSRLDRILENWQNILTIVQEEIPSSSEIAKLFKAMGMDNLLSLQDNQNLFTILQATKDIRDKYILSRLLWDLGIIQEINL